jgi:hypothetical protein
MCYELKWFRGKRATEVESKREQWKTLTERTTVKTPSEPITPAAQPDPATKVQQELEPV